MSIEDLRSTFLFEKLSDEQLDTLAELGTQVMFPVGEIIFAEGQPADFLWVLLNGEVELTRHVGGQRIVIGTLSDPGAYAGGIRAFAASGTGGGYRATGAALQLRFTGHIGQGNNVACEIQVTSGESRRTQG